MIWLVIKTLAFAVVCLLTFRAGAAETAAFKPLQLHPENPHYFLFRGKPTVLVSSGEHYGAVLNQDFDYRTYLDTLKSEGMNLTRAVPGTSLESTNAGTGATPKAESFHSPIMGDSNSACLKKMPSSSGAFPRANEWIEPMPSPDCNSHPQADSPCCNLQTTQRRSVQESSWSSISSRRIPRFFSEIRQCLPLASAQLNNLV